MSKLTIWKYELNLTDNILMVPEGARILDVQSQQDMICAWFVVDPAAPKEQRRFHIVGTGYPMPEGKSTYIGTALVHEDAFVGHVFEVEED